MDNHHPICPVDTQHGAMAPAVTEQILSPRWDAGGANGNPIRFVGLSAFECVACREQGQMTRVPAPETTEALCRHLNKRLLTKVHRHLQGIPGTKPALIVDFGARIPAPGASEGSKSESRSRMVHRPATPKRSIADLLVPEETADQLNLVLTSLAHGDLIYRQWGLSKLHPHGVSTVLNFYGPPGTGKSLAAEALAHQLKKLLLLVNYSELESSLVGETNKNIVALFQAARDADAVLVFDEADSILGQRLTKVSQSADHGVNIARSAMLMELERHQGVVIFTTNLFRNYDRAFLRRIAHHVEFPLPDQETRIRLWEALVPAPFPRAEDVSFRRLAEEFPDTSGGDIRNAVMLAAARTAMEPEHSRSATMDHFQAAIRSVLKAKENHADAPAGEWKPVPAHEVPDDVKARL